jgi:hypothetical protein
MLALSKRRTVLAGKVNKGDGKDVSHRNNNAQDNSSKNLAVAPRSKNRSFPRTRGAKRA